MLASQQVTGLRTVPGRINNLPDAPMIRGALAKLMLALGMFGMGQSGLLPTPTPVGQTATPRAMSLTLLVNLNGPTFARSESQTSPLRLLAHD